MHNAGLKVLQKGTLWTLLVIGQSASAGRLGMDISLERSYLVMRNYSRKM